MAVGQLIAWAVRASCVAQHHPGHPPRGDGGSRQEVGSCTQKLAEDASGRHGHVASDISPEHLTAPCTALRQGLPAQGHLAKGGQRKGTSHANTARAWAVIELNESRRDSWAQGRGQPHGPAGHWSPEIGQEPMKNRLVCTLNDDLN